MLKTYIEKCPICNKRMKEKYHYYEECWGSPVTSERMIFCEVCYYSEEYCYGAERKGFFTGNESDILCWNYCTDYTRSQYKVWTKRMWSKRKELLRNRKIKSRGNMKNL